VNKVILGVLGLGLVAVIVVYWLQLPGEEDPEETAGLVAGNWSRHGSRFRR
jgi:hypothetical protein